MPVHDGLVLRFDDVRLMRIADTRLLTRNIEAGQAGPLQSEEPPGSSG
ncbi:hypothetical protein ACWDT6_24240 [Nocardia grenadensis]